MGTHLSAYVETDSSKRLPPFTKPGQVFSITEGSFTFINNYDIFDALAGGRAGCVAPDERDPNRAPLFAPRGMPEVPSLEVAHDYFCLVAEPDHPPNEHFWPEHGCITTQVAQEWLAARRKLFTETDFPVDVPACYEASVVQWFNCGESHISWRVVSKPHFYNASWLYLDEFDAALEYRQFKLTELPAEYDILRYAMSRLVCEYGRDHVRLVIWFD